MLYYYYRFTPCHCYHIVLKSIYLCQSYLKAVQIVRLRAVVLTLEIEIPIIGVYAPDTYTKLDKKRAANIRVVIVILYRPVKAQPTFGILRFLILGILFNMNSSILL